MFRTVCITAALAGILMAGCGPTYCVYNGGVQDGASRIPRTAGDLQPSEAAASSSSNFAPPEKNVTYGGPTNRTAVRLPAALEPHPFTAVYVSTAPQGLVSVSPTATTAAARNVVASADSGEPASMVDARAAGSLSSPAQQASLRGADAASVNVYVAGKLRADESAATQAPAESKALASNVNPGHLQELGDSNALTAPAHSSTAMDTGVAVSAGVVDKSGGSSVFSSPETPALAADVSVPKGQADSLAPQTVGVQEPAMAASQTATPSAGVVSLAPALNQQSAVLAARAQSAALNTQVDAGEVLDIGDARFIVAASASQGPTVYKRLHVSVTLLNRTIPLAAETSDASAVRQVPANVQQYGALEAPAGMSQPHGALDAATAGAILQGVNLRAISHTSWTLMPRGVAAVSPPTVYVLKEGRRITAGAFGWLTSRQILKDKPKGTILICYRIYVFNNGDSSAANVKVMDRLDASVSMLPNSCFASREDATVSFDETERALEVTVEQLAAHEAFVIEFYVEPGHSE